MKSCTTLLVGVIIGIIALFCFSGYVRANEVFSDDFSFLNTNYWNFNYKPGEIVDIEQNSFLHIHSLDGYSSPYVFLNNINIPDNSYSIKIRFKFFGFLNYGSGIIFSNNLLQYGTSESLKEGDAIFHIWPLNANTVSISSSVCSDNAIGCQDVQISKIITTVNINTWNDLEIQSDSNNVYRLFLNEDIVYTTKPSSLKIKNIWFGNPEIKTNFTIRPEIFIDYLYINNNPQNITSNLNIIIPGLGASWDIGAILTGSDTGNWQIPSFVKNYDGLKSSLINTVGEDKVFVFSYDWRKPLSTLSDRLNQYIDDNIPPGEKVNLIGHSMGGLVARSYAQKYGTSKINKILTIGSPNMGTAKAYGVWEGGLLFEDSWWAKLALEMTTHFGVIVGESNIQTIQRLAPSLKDLLPTYDFLNLNGNILPWSSLSETGKNTFLNNLNQNISQIDPITTAIFSGDFQTNSVIKVIPHTDGDLGTWIDGKPIDNPFINEAGDGTVTSLSGKGAFSNTIQGVGWHGELVAKRENIQKIFSELNFADYSKIVEGTEDTNSNVLVAALKSPGKLEVCNLELTKCNSEIGGFFFSEHKLFILPGFSGENLIIRITEEGTGDYSLHLGNISDTSKWDVEQGNIQADQIDYYNVEINPEYVSLILDKEGPSVPQILGFQNLQINCGGATNQQSITINWENSFDKNGVAGYEYSIDDSKTSFIIDSTLSISLPDEGEHSFKIRAKDRFENYSDWSNSCSITVDRTPPTVVITSPITGTYLPKTLPKLVYEVTDNLDLEPSINIGDMPKSEGAHFVTVTATDHAGNFGKDTASYTIKLPPDNKNLCKNFGWKTYSITGFRNQGACVSFVERNIKATSRLFWWI